VPNDFRCGFVAVLGRPNVGKSTLVNKLVGKKVSITSPKPQTTRHRIMGVVTDSSRQIILVDTPGIHKHKRRGVNALINQVARNSISSVDVILQVISAKGWNSEDELVYQFARSSEIPVVLGINKVDLVRNKEALLPFLDSMKGKGAYKEIVPISAKSGHNTAALLDVLTNYLPYGPAGFPEDQFTDKSEKFQAGEIVREKIFMALGEEIPYSSTVEITDLEIDKDLVTVRANIWVERDSQKAIVIGKKGSRLKQIGSVARIELETYYKTKVYLDVRVKVRTGWTNDEIALRNFGYGLDL